ncbi:MAG: 30S ribosomal protein S17 [Pelagibacteraceae bacterium]|jgi:small subunit ribosomal protein S17
MSKRILKGTVISNKNPKTLVVKVQRTFRHPVFQKVMRSEKKYHAHYETGDFKIGQIIQIIESRPISKLKKWKVMTNK